MKTKTKIKLILFSPIVVLLFQNCLNNVKQIEKKDLIQINIEKAINSQTSIKSIGQFVDTLFYIPLETNEEIIMSNITRIQVYKNQIYISHSKQIYKFDFNGKLLCKIGKRGKGPNEYTSGSNFIIHKDTIYVNGGYNKILAFNSIDGEIISSVKLSKPIFYFQKIRNNFIGTNYPINSIELFNNKGHLIDSLKYEKNRKKMEELLAFSFPNIFIKTPNALNISTYCNDTIFEITDNNKLKPEYIMNLGKYKVPDSKRPQNDKQLIKFLGKSENYLRPMPLETCSYLIIKFGLWTPECKVPIPNYTNNEAGMLGLGVYEKNTNRFYLVAEDKENFPCFYPLFTDGENHLLSFVNSIDAITFYEQNKSKYQFNKSFLETIGKIKIEDNPVVMIAKLKE